MNLQNNTIEPTLKSIISGAKNEEGRAIGGGVKRVA